MAHSTYSSQMPTQYICHPPTGRCHHPNFTDRKTSAQRLTSMPYKQTRTISGTVVFVFLHTAFPECGPEVVGKALWGREGLQSQTRLCMSNATSWAAQCGHWEGIWTTKDQSRVESWVCSEESSSISKNKTGEGAPLSPFWFGGCHAACMPVTGIQGALKTFPSLQSPTIMN